jgi:YD repeat-containing protein
MQSGAVIRRTKSMDEKKSPVYITRKYQYDKDDRIVHVSGDGLTAQIRFGYDPAGNLVSRETEITNPDTRYIAPAARAEAGQMLCPLCHNPVSSGAKFCGQCGAKIP